MTQQPPRVGDKVVKTDAEWKSTLSPEQYYVTRQHGTERAGTSPLNREKREGLFACVCCGEPVFTSADKFESGSGWPSFDKPASGGAVREHEDRSHFMNRTEVRCARCNSRAPGKQRSACCGRQGTMRLAIMRWAFVI